MLRVLRCQQQILLQSVLVVMRAEHFKLIEGSYDIEIAKKGLSRFKHKTANVTYYIAIEAGSSTFGE